MKSALVTGASSGIGHAIASSLASKGWRILAHGRNPDKTRSAALSFGPSSIPLVADLSRTADCLRLASQVRSLAPSLDALILNAATVTPHRQITPEGFEHMFAVNHLAPFILTRLLHPSIPRGGHILAVSTDAHRWIKSLDLSNLQAEMKFRPLRHYASTKAANLLASLEWARLLAPAAISLSLHHPGTVATSFGLGGPWWLRLFWKYASRRFLTPAQAAAPLVATLTHPSPQSPATPYYSKGTLTPPAPFIDDPALQRSLWDLTAALLGPHPISSP